ncbi:amidase family protein [Komagataeibacter rhaeticus]|nr:amidase family protein [Komagataeibacter rhaeticus]
MGPVIGEALAGMSAPHCITRSVRDSAAMLDACAWPEPGDPYAVKASERPYMQEVARDPRRLRIGVSTRSPLGGAVHADCRDAVARAAALCAELGHEVEEAEMAYDAVAVKDAWRVIVGIAALTGVQAQEKKIGLRDRFSMLEPVNAAWMRWASGLSAVDYALALNTIRAAGRSCGRSFEMYDVFLTPAAATPPPRLGNWHAMMRMPKPSMTVSAHMGRLPPCIMQRAARG